MSADVDYDYLFKFLTLGDSGVGKTTFLYQYVENSFNTRFISTVGIDFREKRLLYYSKSRHYRIHLQLWDTSGQERFRCLTKSFFRNAVGFLVLFDVTNEQSFANTIYWIEQLKSHSYCDEPDVILIGNKCDETDLREISEEQARDMASKYKIPYIEVSAKSGKNVPLAIDLLLEMVVQRMENALEIAKTPGQYWNPGQEGKIDLRTSEIRVTKSDGKKCAC